MSEAPGAESPETSPERSLRRSLVDRRGPEPMSPEHRAAVAEGREQIRRGEVAGDEEIEAAFRSFGL